MPNPYLVRALANCFLSGEQNLDAVVARASATLGPILFT